MGSRYTFKLVGLTLNGETPESAEVTFNSCLDPSILDSPKLLSGDSTQQVIGWSLPEFVGGCPIVEYALFRNDGLGGTPVEIDSSTIRGNPTINKHTVTVFPATSIGNSFSYYVKCITTEGEVQSLIVSYPLAGIPASPTTAPVSDSSITSKSIIKVDVGVITNDGGSTLLSYSIEMDDGNGGDFTPLYGDVVNSLSTTFTIMRGVKVGKVYRFRYRTKNLIGWSEFSPIAQVLAASVPDAPPAPIFIAATDLQIQFSFIETQNDNGSPIDSYELWRNDGASSTAYTQVASYTGGNTFTLTTAAETGLVIGKIYSFIFRAHNSIGYSDYSPLTSVGLNNLPTAPTGLVFNKALSNKYTISVSWTPNTITETPSGNILGYAVYMNDGRGGSFIEVFNGNGFPTVTSFTAKGLIPGLVYKFKVQAINFNGVGPFSSEISIYSCEDINSIQAPYYISSTSTSLTVGWNSPAYDGGCSITGFKLFVDDALSFGNPTTEVNALTVNNQPSLRMTTMTLLATDLGTTYTFKLKVFNFNFAGYNEFESDLSEILFAIPPNQPSSPVNVPS
jgi:hypothetical protein